MNKISLYIDKPVILIDTSYFVFYRYFSTLRWYKFKYPEVEVETIDSNEEFVNYFKKHVYNDLKKLCNTWNTTLSNMIFCCDCSRGDIWRNDHHDSYKGKRTVNQLFNPNIFIIFYEYIEENKENWRNHIFNVDCLEADDIVYMTKKKLILHGWTNDIVIITNDNDYLQLLDDKTHIYNMNGNGNDISKRSCGDAKKDLLIKIIMGDKSDNIQPIKPGIGIKTATKLAELPSNEFETYLDKNKCRENFNKNKRMIDFNEIPTNLHVKFNSIYEFQIL